MPTVREIEQALFRLAPKEGAMDWDNVGQLLGDPEAEVRRVLVALDITEAVADEAIAENCQLIVSHHPVMNCKWLPVQTVRQDTVCSIIKKRVPEIRSVVSSKNSEKTGFLESARSGGTLIMLCTGSFLFSESFRAGSGAVSSGASVIVRTSGGCCKAVFSSG